MAVNNSALTTVGWIPDPNGRGTFSLILSCVLTMSLCVWSAMHLNNPPHNSSVWRNWIRGLGWGLAGIFAPKLVVFAAWRQYNSAKELYFQVNPQIERFSAKVRRHQLDISALYASLLLLVLIIPPTSDITHPWTMVHSFYSGMGGFSFELDSVLNEHSQHFIPGDQRLTLSARGIALLAQFGHLPNIPEEDIADKSKADGLAKSFVCLQAGWMVVQIIRRLILDLPITLLEVNLLGHVLCALVIYILWWHKPRLVHEPTVLDGDWVKPLCAYMFMSSQISGSERNVARPLWQAWLQPEILNLVLLEPKSRSASEKLREQSSAPSVQKIPTRKSQSSVQSSISENCGISAPAEIILLSYIGPRPSPSHELLDTYKPSDRTESALNPTAIELERWMLATKALHTYPSLMLRLKERHETTIYDWFEIPSEDLLTRSVTNWPAEDLLRETRGLVMGMAIWCASVAYGAVHVAAWHDYFPTTLEQWLWRSSAVYISFSGALWLLLNLMAYEWKALDAYWDQVLRRQAHWSSYVILESLCTVCGNFDILARLFLVIEAFLGIRQLPIEAYQAPDWTIFLPHF